MLWTEGMTTSGDTVIVLWRTQLHAAVDSVDECHPSTRELSRGPGWGREVSVLRRGLS